ncbi:polyketide synthase [Coccidioides immitis RMSCC 2394]|uniref:Polyketide synthase n=1 Tax=Coccidioides immitis RMSCC 2394 TaxID=404692 RepID=A0A0J7AYJ9_COCIT|nr:polyketide synthase [Coccidioides immitis RMSCC 2394]
MLIPYFTAIHSIVNIGRVTKGQRVWWRGSGSYPGCPNAGGRVVHYSWQQQESQVLDGPLSHSEKNRIFNSRDKTFMDGIMRETKGKLLHATWSCIAEFGTLLEIGKQDLIGDGKLDMKPFLVNHNYCCVDIDRALEEDSHH